MERRGVKTLIIDANISLSQAIYLPYSEQAAAFIEKSRRAGNAFLAPWLWAYEVVSGLRKAVVSGILTADGAMAALEQFELFQIKMIEPSNQLNRLALEWADRLGHSKAYDAQYVAAASQTGSEFWTADKRLANKSVQIGATWVHWVGEIEAD